MLGGKHGVVSRVLVGVGLPQSVGYGGGYYPTLLDGLAGDVIAVVLVGRAHFVEADLLGLLL